jgi:hypothetical protein
VVLNEQNRIVSVAQELTGNIVQENDTIINKDELTKFKEKINKDGYEK